MAGKLQTIVQKDFSGGVNAVSSPFLVGDKQLQRVRNMQLDEQGALTTRDGYAVLTTSPDLSNPLKYRGVLNKVDGTSIPFAIQGPSGPFAPTMYRTDTNPWTVISTPGFAVGVAVDIPQTFTMNDVEMVICGYQTPRHYDGGVGLTPITAAGGQTVPPGAMHGAFHLGSMWVWNTSPVTTSLDGPSSLRMSDPNNFNSWPNANQTFIAKDDGQVGMGLAQFTLAETGISPTQTIVAFKNYSGYQVTGVFGSANFSIQRIKSDMGCISPRTIQFVSGFGLIRLTHKGFALFNGVDDKLISEEVRPYIFGHDEIPGLNFSSLNLSWAAQSQNPPLYVAACPIGGTQLNRVFIYDLVRKAWTIADFPINFNCLNLFSTLTTQPVIHGGTSSGGQIVRLFGGDTTDNGALVNWNFRTRAFYQGDFMTNTYWRRLLVDAGLATVPTPITMTATLLGIATPVSATHNFTGHQAGTLWGTGVWGQFTWAGSTIVDARHDLEILKVAPAVTFDLQGSGHVSIRGLQIQARTKPPSRSKI